ncbi:MAG: hypothetical protein HOP14_08320 [Acidobacteria bacterium]|nr:hypothetical protein [Acidobacteriota bacterium]
MILVVGTPHLLEAASARLEREGYAVTVARDAEAAACVASLSRPALIVLELDTVRGDGLEVCRVLTALPDLAGVPLVVSSATPEPLREVVGGTPDVHVVRASSRPDALLRIVRGFHIRPPADRGAGRRSDP